MKVRPLHDRIIVQRIEEEEQRVGGIIIPDTAKEKPQQGKVIAVGKGRVEKDGKVAAEQAWESREIAAPLAPIVVNGLVFVASSGEYRGTEANLTAAERAKRSKPAVLYALDPSPKGKATVTPDSARRGSRSSKLAMRGRRGTAMR